MSDIRQTDVVLEELKKALTQQKRINSAIHGIEECKSCSLMERIESTINDISQDSDSE